MTAIKWRSAQQQFFAEAKNQVEFAQDQRPGYRAYLGECAASANNNQKIGHLQIHAGDKLK